MLEMWEVQDRPDGNQVATMYFIDEAGYPHPTGDSFTGYPEVTAVWLRFRGLEPLAKCDCPHCAPVYVNFPGQIWTEARALAVVEQ